MKKTFNFPYSELIQRSDKLEPIVVRDLEPLSVYGFARDTALKIRTRADILRDLPTDEYWLGQQMLKTNCKNEARAKIDELLTDFRHRCKRALGENSVNFKLFRFSRLASMNDRDIIIFGNNAINSAESMQDALASHLIDANYLEHLKSLIRELDNALDEQTEIEKLRTRKQSERMQLANGLYQLISDVCETGKLIWKGKDENNYTDYVIYGAARSGKEQSEVQEREDQ